MVRIKRNDSCQPVRRRTRSLSSNHAGPSNPRRVRSPPPAGNPVLVRRASAACAAVPQNGGGGRNNGGSPAGTASPPPPPNPVVEGPPPNPPVEAQAGPAQALPAVAALYFRCGLLGGPKRVELPFTYIDARLVNPNTIMKGYPGIDIRSASIHYLMASGKMESFRVFYRLGEGFLTNPGLFALTKISWKGDMLVVRVGVREECVSISSSHHNQMARQAAQM